MNAKLLIFKINGTHGNSLAKRFRFAVIDLDRSKNYPVNYVCMLPVQINPRGKKPSTFSTIFGDRSLNIATQLLASAFETFTDAEVKAEIERRLKAIEARDAKQID